MRLYFDTSALLPYYREELASARVQARLEQHHQSIAISRLTEVEFASALSRLVRSKELTRTHASEIENALDHDKKSGLFISCSVEDKHFEFAHYFLTTRKTGLRTLDALHLALAAIEDTCLVTEDACLYQAAQFFGVPTQKA